MIWKRISPNDPDIETETPVGTYTISFDHPAAGGAAYLFVPYRDTVYLTITGPGAKKRAMDAAEYHLEHNMRFSRG